MNDNTDEFLDQTTVAFLRQASALSQIDLNLKAELAVTSKNYGYTPSRKELLCSRCCLTLASDRLTFKIGKRKRRRFLTSACSYCGQKQTSASISHAKISHPKDLREKKSKSIDKVGGKNGRSKKAVREAKVSTFPSSIPEQSAVAPSISKANPKKRAKTLSKLASLNDEKNRIESTSGGSSLLAFMKSLKR